MSLATIKEEYKGRRVGFNNSAKPLGQRKDIDDLAIIAIESQDPSLLRLFEKLPSLAELIKQRVESQLKRPYAKT